LTERADYNRRLNNNKLLSVTTFVARSAQANVSIAYICFLLFADSTTFLVEKDQHRSLPAFASVNVSYRISAITAKHSLFRLSHTCNSIGSPYGLLSSKEENYGFSTFHLNTTDGLGSAFPPVAQHLRWKRLEFPILATYLLVSACQHLWLIVHHGVYQQFTFINHTVLF